jgi:uncharacterized protein (DUF488 family)
VNGSKTTIFTVSELAITVDSQAGERRFVVYAVDHSTRSLDEFVGLLKKYAIEQLVDIRTVPRSRHNPQFNQDILEESLHLRQVSYQHLKELGGLRHAHIDSVNTGWRNASFRGFADYMQTPPFAAAIERFTKIAQEQTTVIMCAEAVPWRCHRSLVGDALVVRGVEVRDIFSQVSMKLHALSPLAKVQETKLYYP